MENSRWLRFSQPLIVCVFGLVSRINLLGQQHLESDLHRALDHPFSGQRYERVHPLFQHLGHEGVWSANHEFAVTECDAHGVFEPRLEVGPRDVHLQVAQDCFP